MYLKSTFLGITSILIGALSISCTNLDDVNSRIDNVENNVGQIVKTATDVNEAVECVNYFKSNGSILSLVKPWTSDVFQGYLCSFDDGSKLFLHDSVLTSYNTNEEEGICLLTLSNGEVLELPTKKVDVEGLVIIRTDPVVMEWNGEENFEIRVNPSNATFNYDISSPDCQITIDEARTKSASYISTPTGYKVVAITPSVNKDGEVLRGQFTVKVADNGYLGVYDTDATVVFSKSENDKTTFLSSNPINIKSAYNYIPVKTDLPTVNITTPGLKEIVSKDDWMADAEIKVFNSDNTLDFEGSSSVKGRGNSTWQAPKKPYALKLDKKNSILGLPKHKRWVLLADYYDDASLRNNLALTIGNEISKLDWTPHPIPVTVTLNGEYKGQYVLTEQVKIDENRVNVGDDGFLMEIDSRAPNPDETDPYFYVATLPSPVGVKDFDETEESFNYIKDFVNRASDLLFSENFSDPVSGWSTMFDIDSFVEWYLVQEISKNNDSCFFSSCYMNLKRGGKLKMGPLWDFDLSFGNYPVGWGSLEANDPEGFYIKKVGWFDRMFQDPVFVSKVKERYADYYNSMDKILSYIDNIENNTSIAFQTNYAIWKEPAADWTVDPSGQFRHTETSKLKEWIQKRMNWLNSAISLL